MKITFIDGTEGKSRGREVTLQVLAECGGVKRMVQGFVTRAERDAKAEAVFADILKAGVAPTPVEEPEYDSKWPKEINAVKAVEL